MVAAELDKLVFEGLQNRIEGVDRGLMRLVRGVELYCFFCRHGCLLFTSPTRGLVRLICLFGVQGPMTWTRPGVVSCSKLGSRYPSPMRQRTGFIKALALRVSDLRCAVPYGYAMEMVGCTYLGTWGYVTSADFALYTVTGPMYSSGWALFIQQPFIYSSMVITAEPLMQRAGSPSAMFGCPPASMTG
jgi:hypothetical protein